jgi:hypothetical protein
MVIFPMEEWEKRESKEGKEKGKIKYANKYKKTKKKFQRYKQGEIVY